MYEIMNQMHEQMLESQHAAFMLRCGILTYDELVEMAEMAAESMASHECQETPPMQNDEVDPNFDCNDNEYCGICEYCAIYTDDTE